jgi:sec-independent protein translocase protein TatA
MSFAILGFFGGMGGGELLLIALIALLLFGTRLPKVARSLGQSVNEFKQGMKDPPQTPAEGDKSPPAK